MQRVFAAVDATYKKHCFKAFVAINKQCFKEIRVSGFFNAYIEINCDCDAFAKFIIHNFNY